MYSNAKEIGDNSFIGTRLKKKYINGPTMIIFYATWCPYCKSKETRNKITSFRKKGYIVYSLESSNPSSKPSKLITAFPTFANVHLDGSIHLIK